MKVQRPRGSQTRNRKPKTPTALSDATACFGFHERNHRPLRFITSASLDPPINDIRTPRHNGFRELSSIRYSIVRCMFDLVQSIDPPTNRLDCTSRRPLRRHLNLFIHDIEILISHFGLSSNFNTFLFSNQSQFCASLDIILIGGPDFRVLRLVVSVSRASMAEQWSPVCATGDTCDGRASPPCCGWARRADGMQC